MSVVEHEEGKPSTIYVGVADILSSGKVSVGADGSVRVCVSDGVRELIIPPEEARLLYQELRLLWEPLQVGKRTT